MKLRTKAIIFFGGFLAVTALLISFYAEYIVGNIFKSHATNDFNVIAEQSESIYLAYLKSIGVRTNEWASDSTIRSLTKTMLSTPKDSPRYNNAAQEFSKYLNEVKLPLDKTIVIADLLDVNGIVIASTQPDRIGDDEKAEELEHLKVHDFDSTINSKYGEVFFGTIIINETEGNTPLMNTTVRIFDTTTTYEHIPLDAVLLLYFSNATEVASVLGTGESASQDSSEQKGRLTSRALLENYRTSDVYLVNSERTLVTPTRDIKDLGVHQKIDSLPVRKCLEEGREVSEEYDDYQGVRVLGASMCFRNEGIVMIVEVEKDEIFASLRALTKYTVVGGIIVLIIGTLLVVLFIQKNVSRINNIVRTAKQVAGGDLSVAAKNGTDDEIGYLASAFNIMIASVRSHEESLQAAKRALEKERANLKKAQELAQVGSWELDIPNNKLTWSDEVYHLFEKPAGTSLTYEEFLAAVHPEDKEYVDTSWSAALGGAPYDIEHRIIINGKVKWVRERAELQFDEQGNATRGAGTVQDITERKQTEEKYRTLIEKVKAAIVVHDKDTRILITNTTAQELLGLTENELLGKDSIDPAWNFYNENSVPLSPEEYPVNQVIAKKAPLTGLTLGIHRPQGKSDVWVIVNADPVFNKQNELEQIIVTFTDITKQKESEEALKESSSKFRGIFENALDGILLADAETKKLVLANPVICRMLDYSAEEITHLGVQDIHPEQDLPHIIEQFEKQLRGETDLASNIPVKRKDGSVFYADIKSSPAHFKGRTYLVGIFRDITERKKIEDSMAAHEAELKRLNQSLEAEKIEIKNEKAKDEALLESIGEGIIATDKNGIIITMNRAAEQILGWGSAELVGKLSTDAVPAIDENNEIIPAEKREVSIAMTTKTKTVSSTTEYIRKNGSRVPVYATVSPVILENELIGAIGVFRDITKEQELDATRRDLLSLASHQLRTPLSGTKWLIETLKKGLHGPLTEKQTEYLNEIYKINERMTTLVHDMMDVLRIESGITTSKKEQVSTKTLLKTIIDSVEVPAKQKKLTLESPDFEDYMIETDSLLLRNILDVFVSNAINYSHPDSKIILGVKKDPAAFIFFVQDFGIGIPKDERVRMFERFYRASNAKVFDTRGTGLGLYIASVLARKINATLSLESEEGVGSTFYVRIPYPQEPLPENATRV